MRTDTPYLTDLFAISMRWLILVGMAVSLGVKGNGLSLATMMVLILAIVWNSYMSFQAIINRRIRWHRPINVTLDILFGLAIYATAGGSTVSILGAALLSLFSGAVYFEIRGSVAVAVILSLLQAGYRFLLTADTFAFGSVWPTALFNLAVGILVTLIGIPVVRHLRGTYRSAVSQREETQRSVQRIERNRMRALFEMIETFSSTLNYQTVLETVLDTALESIKTYDNERKEMLGAVLLFGGTNDLEVRASRGFMRNDLNTRLPADDGVLYEALKTGEARQILNPVNDPEISLFVSLQDRKVALVLPLIRGMNAFGVLLFAHENEKFFSKEKQETLEMLSNQAVIALQNARLYQDLAREKERIVQSQEEAAKKLARDLHDGPTQSISAIAMRISIARKILEQSPKEAGDELVKIEELARRTTEEIRHMLFTLRPLVLESEGLIAALCTMADKMRDVYQQNVIVDADAGLVNLLDMPRQTVIFYIVEESLNNVRKYANATEVHVRLKYPGNVQNIALLEVADNGIGFDVQKVMGAYDRRGSLGMINLRERTDMVNGVIKIDSALGKGTRVRVFIPLNEEAADRLRNGR